MRNVIIVFIVIGIIILIMSNIRVALPITNATTPNFDEIINVTPGLRLIISDKNGSLTLIPIRGYSMFIDTIDYLSPIFVFVGIIISIVLLIMRGKQSIDVSDPLFFGIILMLIVALAFALPIPIQVYVGGESTTQSMLIGVNAYVGFSSITYLISTVLLIISTWLYSGGMNMDEVYSDIDQLMNMTIMLKSEEETEQSEEQ